MWFADGYSALLVKTVAGLRRFGGTESWRIACAVLLRDLAARPDAYVCVCLVSLRLCVSSLSPSVSSLSPSHLLSLSFGLSFFLSIFRCVLPFSSLSFSLSLSVILS